MHNLLVLFLSQIMSAAVELNGEISTTLGGSFGKTYASRAEPRGSPVGHVGTEHGSAGRSRSVPSSVQSSGFSWSSNKLCNPLLVYLFHTFDLWTLGSSKYGFSLSMQNGAQRGLNRVYADDI